MSKEKMSFGQWLEETYGVSWSYFDNNFSAKQADEVFAEYGEYLEGA